MAVDYEVGDVVIKIAGKKNVGKIGRVETMFVHAGSGDLGITLIGWDNGGVDRDFFGWLATSFKKLPKADDEFTSMLRRMKPRVRERETV